MNIEERVTKLVFDTSQFGSKIQGVLSQLAQLRESLKLEGAQKGLQDVSDTANKFSMSGMKDQVSGVLGQFNALQVAAITALSNIVNKAVEAGTQIVKSLTIQPILSGFREYETNLNSIQTILANTGLEGAAGLAKVTGKLNELNEYSDQTIYNFSEMAKNIGTFTAAGVDLDKSTAAIKGIANLAAISGSNSQQASAAMYQLSQALSAGKVSLEDWNSVVNAGLGGKVFRDSLIETARVHGVKIDEIIKKQGSFRNSIQEGWITTDILAETLSKFTGDLSEEQLKSLGYTKQQIEGIQKMGKTATDAATKVKTMTQLLDTLRESAGSGWAKTWQIIFGDFDEARGMFTDVSNVLGGAINQMSDARNKLLQGWKDLGGRDAVIDGIANAFQALLSVLRPIGQAFREMFPATTAQELYNLSVRFRDFMANLKIGSETANNLRRTFAGLFAILGIGWDLLKAGAQFVANLIGKFSEGSGGILRFTGNIGDFLVALRKALQEGRAFEKIFGVLTKIVNAVATAIGFVGSLISRIFRHLDLAPAEEMLKRVAAAGKPVLSLGELISAVYSRAMNVMKNMTDNAYQGFVKLWNWVQKVVQGIQDMFNGGSGEGLSANGLLKGAALGSLIAFLTTLTRFFSNFKPAQFLDALIDSFEALTGALRAMQNALNAAALLGIAAAIGILAVSMEKLSRIDQAGLIRASAAIAVLMGELAGAFVLFDKVGGTLGATKLIIVSTALIRLGAALLILVTAVEKLSKLSWDQLAKGLTGVLVLVGTLVAGVKFLPSDIAGVVKTATALVVLTIAVRNLVNAVEDLSQLSWEQLAKGLVGVGALLGSLALFTKFAELDKGGIFSGLGIVLIAASLKILASAVGDFVKFNWEQLARGMAAIAVGLGLIAAALLLIPPTSIFSAAGVLIVAASLGMIADGVKKMSALSWGEIGRGLTVMAGALLAIALAIGFLPPSSLLSAAAVLIVAASLGMIQEALGKMSGMTWEEIGKGLVVLAGSLLIIAGALFLMQNAIPGAAAVLIVAAALRVLTPVLQALGNMTWEQIAKGLLGLAGVFLVLGAAGILIGPLAGVITSLAGSIFLLGLAVLAAGVGMLAFATGLGILATVGAGATAVLVGIVSGLSALIPVVIEQIGLGIIAFARVIAVSGKAINDAFTTILLAMIESVITLTPKITELLAVLLSAALALMVDYIPKMADAGARIIIGVLEGMQRHIGRIVDKATDLVVNFLDAIGRNLPRVTQAGAELVIRAVNGVADAIRNNSAKMGEAGVNLASALIEGTIRGIAAGIGRAAQKAADMANEMLKAAKNAIGIKSPSRDFREQFGQQVGAGAALGVEDNAHLASTAVEDMGDNMIDAMAKSLTKLSSVLGSDLIDFDPTITPVLDLSEVAKDAKDLLKLMDIPSLDVSSTSSGARSARSNVDQSRSSEGDPFEGSGGTTYNFTQNNTSPKALPPAEIYRNTQNIISRAAAKGV